MEQQLSCCITVAMFGSSGFAEELIHTADSNDGRIGFNGNNSSADHIDKGCAITHPIGNQRGMKLQVLLALDMSRNLKLATLLHERGNDLLAC